MTNKNDQQQSLAEISRQAAVVWLLLKDEPRLTLDDAWHILLWLMRSRRHVRAPPHASPGRQIDPPDKR